MKKIVYILVIIGSLFISDRVLAENFYEGDYLGIYVNKYKNNKTYYLNMQLLVDGDSKKLVYCLEPFEFFNTNSIYNIYQNNYDGYKLSSDKLDRINKLVKYGYGYVIKNRMDYKWYAITQVLIWKTVDPDADIYFTDKLNGNRVDKYVNEIRELEEDVDNEGTINILKSTHEISYGSKMSIGTQETDYEIVESDCNAYMNVNLHTSNLYKDSYVILREINTNSIDGYNIIYESNGNQDLIVSGKLSSKTKKILIKVLKGSITLDIKKDNETKISEADFTNTCYGLYKNGIFVKKVCASDNQITKIDNLEYGDYTIKQLSVGIGYIKDKKIYEVTINSNNQDVIVNLYNKIISNNLNIIKKFCSNNICREEENAVFEVYNNMGDNLGSYSTNNRGIVNIELAYGKYDIVQMKGIDGYEMIPSFNINIVDSTSIHNYELYDKEIIKEEIEEDEEIELTKEEVKDEVRDEEVKVLYVVEDEVIEDNKDIVIEELPPNTYVKLPVKNILVKVCNKIVSYIKKVNKLALLL